MPITSEIGLEIRKYAIKNAMDYGKASEGAVLNKIISLHTELKGDIKSLSIAVKAEVEKVNTLSKQDVEKEYSVFSEEFAKAEVVKAKETAKPKFILDGVKDGDFIGRASPEPSGYAHMGHAKQALLNSEFARIYKGKMYLYFDDTNPEKCKQEYVDAIRRDLGWLGVKFEKEYYASDNVEKIYDYAKALMKDGKAYVCQCEREEMSKKRFDGIDCEHRNQSTTQNLKLFDDMLTGKFEEGKAIVRFLGDMKAQNTVLRDPAILRIVKAPHYRQGTKYSVWPLYDFNTPILDSLNGITDIIRGKEYELRDELVRQLLGTLKLRVPRMHLEARLNIKGNVVQKRVIRQLVSDGLITSWDDPRLMTLMALRRRGVRAEAIRDFVLSFGMTKTDSTVSIDALLAYNRKIIEPIAKHLFFVNDPVKVNVNGAEKSEVKLKLYPNSEDHFREYTTNNIFYISKADAKDLRPGNIIRLKDLMDVKIEKNDVSTISAERLSGTTKGKIIQWVSEGNFQECTVLMPGEIVDDEDKFNPDSLKIAKGYVENYSKKLEEHDEVQFERFGYCILDNKSTMQFILTSE